MARRGKKPKGRPVNGWIVLDKPAGMGSTDCVSAIKRLFFAQKAGHAGTLDPLATGMLPIALGDATKTVPFVVDGAKVYRFTVRWGAETTTDDSEGEITRTSATRPAAEAIAAALGAYEGEIQQVPPAYSAIKIDGARAYDLAREGETVEIAARPITVHSLTMIATPDADTAVFEAECGRGTYVRAIARDLGRDLGCLGHIVELRRVCVGGFDEDDMVTLDELREVADEGRETLDAEAIEAGAQARIVDYSGLDAYVIAPEAALSDIHEVMLSDEQAGRVLSGNAVLLRGRDAPASCEEAFAIGHGRLIALGSVEQGSFLPKRVFSGPGR